jgi:hypothetical protein
VSRRKPRACEGQFQHINTISSSSRGRRHGICSVTCVALLGIRLVTERAVWTAKNWSSTHQETALGTTRGVCHTHSHASWHCYQSVPRHGTVMHNIIPRLRSRGRTLVARPSAVLICLNIATQHAVRLVFAPATTRSGRYEATLGSNPWQCRAVSA